jgi:hypothetical protein
MSNNTTKGVKKSAFLGKTDIPAGTTFDYVLNGVNYKITGENLIGSLGATGTLVQTGPAVGAVPVLDVSGTVNRIRNITNGFGIAASVNAENGITLSTDFGFNEVGAELVDDVEASSAQFRSLVAGTGVNISAVTGQITISANTSDSIIVVKTGSQLTGAIDSSKVYFLDGIIDMTGLATITVPASGISIIGNDQNISQLISSTPGHVMFTGTGPVKMTDLSLSVTGAGAVVYDLTGATGSELLDLFRVNYINCKSLGEITNFQQCLELSTVRFGGNPSLTLSGSWDGYSMTTALITALDNTVSEPIFKAGTALTFSTRFVTDVNADLGTLAAFSDFSPANFVTSSSFKINNALFTRNNVLGHDDSTINTGTSETDITSNWQNNSGIGNTFEGGRLQISAIATTVLSGSAIGTFVDVNGTFDASELVHFDSPVNGRLRHAGIYPRDYTFFLDLVMNGTPPDLIRVKIVKWDNSSSTFVDVFAQTREIATYTGANDFAQFILKGAVNLDQNDYVKVQVANLTGARNVTAKLDDYLIIEAR